MMSTLLTDSLAARSALVDEHVRCENAHDLDGILRTFGSRAAYDDGPWSERCSGADEVRGYYARLLESVPDLHIDVVKKHVAQDEIILEVVIRGTHQATWRGLPATWRRVEVPLCAIYTFDERDRLVGERIYYDRATVLKQLGVFREPQTLLGKIGIAAGHPLTMLQIGLRMLSRKREAR
jgi:steroid delta-isomerase-like uncharacterized protein